MAAKIPETSPYPRFPDSSFKYTPLRHVRVLFLNFVRGLFHAAPPGAYHWEDDEERTEIVISDEMRVRAEACMRRPAIIFTRGPIQFYSLGIDDRVRYDMTTGEKEKAVLVPGTMTVNCVSRVVQECEDLAWVVGEHLWLLRDLLMQAGFFDIGREPQFGAPSPAGSLVANDSAEEFFVVAVTVPFMFARNSSFTPLGRHIANNIRLTLSQAVPQGPSQPQGFSHGGHEIPVNVHECPPPHYTVASNALGKSPDPAGKTTHFLPKQRHPLDPAKMVTVRTVRPNAHGRPSPLSLASVPIPEPCVKQSS